MLDNLYAFVEGLTQGIGESDEVMLLTICVALLALWSALRSSRLVAESRAAAESGNLLKSGLQGKIAKLEHSLNDLRTETLREVTMLKNTVLKNSMPGHDAAEEAGVAEEQAAPEAEEEAGEEAETEEGPQEEEAQEAEATTDEEGQALSVRLGKTRGGFLDRLKGLFSIRPRLDAESMNEVESLLISSDLGVKTSGKLMEDLKETVSAGAGLDQSELKLFLRDRIVKVLEEGAPEDPALKCSREAGKPCVVLVVGINGVGKTTTVAKLADSLKREGLSVLVAAGDTFRAAAVEQLREWADRVGVPVVSGKEDARPQTVVFDAVKKAVDEKFDVVLVDTAGRLHTKSNLMQELEGISGVVKKINGTPPDETILVVDGATGQNALQQAKEFHEAVPLTGIIVTKLDGTPKGGIVVAIKDEFGIPIRYIGVGESMKDLRPFDAREFADAIFSEEAGSSAGKLSSHAATRKRKAEAQAQA